MIFHAGKIIEKISFPFMFFFFLALMDEAGTNGVGIQESDLMNDAIIQFRADLKDTNYYLVPVLKAETTQTGIYPQQTTIVFSRVIGDYFEAFDNNTGTFKAPKRGSYMASFEGQTKCPTADSRAYFMLNGNKVGSGGCHENAGTLPTTIQGASHKFADIVIGDEIQILSGELNWELDTQPIALAIYYYIKKADGC